MDQVIGLLALMSILGLAFSQSCMTDWIKINNSCYRIFQDYKNYTEAAKHCEDVAEHLAIVRNNDTNYMLSKKLNGESWIGLYKNGSWCTRCGESKKREGWHWPDGSSVLGYTNWDLKEPSGDSPCARMMKSGKWRDLNCNTKYHFVCEATLKDSPQSFTSQIITEEPLGNIQQPLSDKETGTVAVAPIAGGVAGGVVVVVLVIVGVVILTKRQKRKNSRQENTYDNGYCTMPPTQNGSPPGPYQNLQQQQQQQEGGLYSSCEHHVSDYNENPYDMYATVKSAADTEQRVTLEMKVDQPITPKLKVNQSFESSPNIEAQSDSLSRPKPEVPANEPAMKHSVSSVPPDTIKPPGPNQEVGPEGDLYTLPLRKSQRGNP